MEAQKDELGGEMLLECATKRLACVGLDWSRVSVKDVFKMFDSFLSHSSLTSVKLYKNKLGREKLGNCCTYTKNKRTGRYYLAVAEFRSIEDSVLIYETCDGNELENSGMFLDLRFISDDTVLGDACDEATSCESYNEKRFVSKSRDVLKDEDTDTDDLEAEIQALFEQKEIDLDAVYKFVDMSDDEETKNTFKSLLTKTNSADASPEDRSDCEDSGSDFNEVYNLLLKKSSKKNEKGFAAKEPKKNAVKIASCSASKDEYKAFVFDPKDERFGVLFEDDDFAIDPTHPEYKKKGGMKDLLDEKRRRFRDTND